MAFISNFNVEAKLSKIKYDEEGKIQYDENNEIISREEWDNPEIPRLITFDLTGLDISLVNGLRRIVMSEVESLGISEIKMNDTVELMKRQDKERFTEDNITIFDTEFIKDRTSMIPIHIDSDADMRMADNLLLCLSDPSDPNMPIVNDNQDNTDKKILAKDLLVLRKMREDEDENPFLTFNTDKVGYNTMNELTTGEEEKPLGGTLKSIKVIDKYVIDDQEKWIKYPDMILAILKKGESLIIPVMKISKGSPKARVDNSEKKEIVEDAKWMAAICNYKFDLGGIEKIDNDAQQNYPKAGGELEQQIWGHFESPAKFNVTLEYNGHMNPMLAWKKAIKILDKKLDWLQLAMNKIRDQITINEYNYRNEEERAKLIVDLIKDTPGLVKLTIMDEDHTLGNIIRSHFLYNIELGLITQGFKDDEFVLALQNSMSQYKIPHPLDNKLEIVLKAPVELNLNGIKQTLNYDIPDDDFIEYRNTLVLLDHVLNRLGNEFIKKLNTDTTTYYSEPVQQGGQYDDFIAPDAEEKEEEDYTVEYLNEEEHEAEDYEQDEEDDQEDEAEENE